MSYARIEIAPSILASNFAKLGDEIRTVEQGGADVLHVDVMDGHFVPNISIGIPVVASLRKATRLPLDVHLMIEHPEELYRGLRSSRRESRAGASGSDGAPGPSAGDDSRARSRSRSGDQSRDSGRRC